MNIAKKIEDFFTNVSDDRLEELLARADFDKYNSICSDVLPPLATPLITPVMQGWQ